MLILEGNCVPDSADSEQDVVECNRYKRGEYLSLD